MKNTLKSAFPYSLLHRLLLCILTLGFFLYSYIDRQNEITQRRLAIPLLAKEIKDIKEKNTCLQYQIDLFESPERLMELASRSEYAYLKQPLLKEVLALEKAPSLREDPFQVENSSLASSRLQLAARP